MNISNVVAAILAGLVGVVLIVLGATGSAAAPHHHCYFVFGGALIACAVVSGIGAASAQTTAGGVQFNLPDLPAWVWIVDALILVAAAVVCAI